MLALEGKVAGQVVTETPGGERRGPRSDASRSVAKGQGAGIFGRATTDLAGRFVIGGPAAGRVNVLLDDVLGSTVPGRSGPQPIRVVPGETAVARIELVTGVTVTGSVASTEGGRLRVSKSLPMGARKLARARRPGTTDTDAKRVMTLSDGLPGDLFVTINGRVAGYMTPGNGESTRSVVIPNGGSAATLPPFVRMPGVKLVGRIVDARRGMPLPGARLIGVCNQNLLHTSQSAVRDRRRQGGGFSLDTQADGPSRSRSTTRSTSFVRLADGKEFDVSARDDRVGACHDQVANTPRRGPQGPDQVAPDELAGVVV